MILLLNSLASEQWPISYPDQEIIININSYYSYSQTNFLLRAWPLVIMSLPKNLIPFWDGMTKSQITQLRIDVRIWLMGQAEAALVYIMYRTNII